MNWSDLVVLAIIAGFGLIGLSKGFIFSLFRLASFFISALISVKLYPVVAKILMDTQLYFNIKASILKNLLRQQELQAPAIDGQIKQAAADQVVNGMQLPGFLKNTIINQLPDPSKMFPISQIAETISGILARVVIDVISLVLLYILIRIGLVFLRFILEGIAKLPIFKQVNKLGGFAFGAVEGLLTIYIIFAVLLLFNTAPQFKGIFDAVDNSIVAKFFYQNNFIVDWMFPGKGPI